ncbi:hypothetical protein ABGB19_09585 [Mycobacterium sp. B14F4]|uniref:hypothetical protein n=1 Tax=Mycobacterium sp. B14F4 TaxID=3153565 RepID=UPI00325EDD6A
MRLDRRWWIAIGVGVVTLIALLYTVIRQPPEECRPVADLMEFNRSSGEAIAARSEGAEGLPSAADEIAYQQWADGLAERARNIDARELRFTAVEVADLAGEFVQKLPELRSASAARAPGAPTPQVVYEMAALDDQIQRKLAELADACSG